MIKTIKVIVLAYEILVLMPALFLGEKLSDIEYSLEKRKRKL